MNFIPTHCPACNSTLSIDTGKKEDVIKLMCTNPNCIGTQLKKLQKGIIALEIKGLGPSTIEKLLTAGITKSYDLFNKSICNEELLIQSGEFKKGRALTKILDTIDNVKEISVNKAILSLQLENIGKTFSEKIGEKLSELTPDYTSLMLDIRDKLDDPNSELNFEIKESLEKFEEYGVRIKYIEKKEKKVKIKKINKKVQFSGFDDIEEMKNIVETQLLWEVTDDFQLLIVENKNSTDNLVKKAKDNNIKIMTWKQIKLLFL
jgi:DNA ligase (NAD+)